MVAKRFFTLWMEAMGLRNRDIVCGLPKDHTRCHSFPPSGLSSQTVSAFKLGAVKKLSRKYEEALCEWSGMTSDELYSVVEVAEEEGRFV